MKKKNHLAVSKAPDEGIHNEKEMSCELVIFKALYQTAKPIIHDSMLEQFLQKYNPTDRQGVLYRQAPVSSADTESLAQKTLPSSSILYAPHQKRMRFHQLLCTDAD